MAFVAPQEAAARSATWGSPHLMSSLGLYKVPSHHQGLHIQIIRCPPVIKTLQLFYTLGSVSTGRESLMLFLFVRMPDIYDCYTT